MGFYYISLFQLLYFILPFTLFSFTYIFDIVLPLLPPQHGDKEPVLALLQPMSTLPLQPTPAHKTEIQRWLLDPGTAHPVDTMKSQVKSTGT